MEVDLHQERELVALVEQRMMLAEDQKESLMHEVEELKQSAKEATKEENNEATNSSHATFVNFSTRALNEQCAMFARRRNYDAPSSTTRPPSFDARGGH